MTPQEIYDLYLRTEGTILSDKKRLVFDIETLDTGPRASVVSAAFVGVGSVGREYNVILANLEYDQTTPVTTPMFYSAWGHHARVVAEKGKCTKNADTLRWWGTQPPKAQEALWDNNEDWEQDTIEVSAALAQADEVWTMHPHFDQPRWEHWCLVHGLPTGAHYRAYKDLQTIFDDFPQVERCRPTTPHHSLFDCLATGFQLEQCLILREYFSRHKF